MVVAFPRIYYFFGKIFKSILDSKLGHLVPNVKPEEYEEDKDGVAISHLTIKKIKPHGRYPRQQVERAFQRIVKDIQKNGIPDFFVGHWDNPQLELLNLLKEKYGRPTCLVFHSNQFSYLTSIYGEETKGLLKKIDLIGFRNLNAKNEYVKLFGEPNNTFIAASGVSRPFIEAGLPAPKTFGLIQKFIYVGLLMQRKYPTAVVEALAQVYKNEEFDLTFIGNGDEKQNIQDSYDKLNCRGKLTLTGRIPRVEVINYLKESDVFVMISKDEIFGLVYLEAMALGCITIAARNEGVDGIIEDGVNGFLCEAGNVEELVSIIQKIRSMSLGELNEMSRRAKETAEAYSDVNVAERYLENLKSILI
jgi:glycosyltransferase involved in cell wall biosynthesis